MFDILQIETKKIRLKPSECQHQGEMTKGLLVFFSQGEQDMRPDVSRPASTHWTTGGS
jgi:hypothetical protein